MFKRRGITHKQNMRKKNSYNDDYKVSDDDAGDLSELEKEEEEEEDEDEESEEFECEEEEEDLE